MRYYYEMQDGQRLEFENEGGQTHIGISSSGTDQQQSQSNKFNTGEWSKPPSLFGLKNELILEIHTGNGSRFMRISGTQMQSMESKPDLGNAEALKIKESSESTRQMKPMEPMQPMKPMVVDRMNSPKRLGTNFFREDRKIHKCSCKGW
jgi:hypothetical protein